MVFGEGTLYESGGFFYAFAVKNLWGTPDAVPYCFAYEVLRAKQQYEFLYLLVAGEK